MSRYHIINESISLYHISIYYYEYNTCFTTASPCSNEVASKASATVKRSHLSRFSGEDRDDNDIDHNEDGEDDLVSWYSESLRFRTRTNSQLGSKWRNGGGIDKLVHVPRIDTFARNSSYIFLFLIVEPMSILR